MTEQPWLRSPERVAESIEVSSKGLGAFRSIVRRYWLTYTTINARPYLTNVVMEGRCESPVYETSEWDGRRNTMRLPGTSTCPRATPGTSYTYSHAGEIAAGGYVGAQAPVKLAFAPASPNLSLRNVVAVDANRDGLVDLVELGTTPATRRVHINGGRGGEPTSRQLSAVPLATSGPVTLDKKAMSVFGRWDDTWGATFVNGYGAATRADGGPRNLAVLTAAETGFALNDFASSAVSCCAFAIPTMPPPHVFGDLDGDGTSDVMYLNETVTPSATQVRFSKRQIAGPPASSHGSTQPFAQVGTTNLRLRIQSYAPRLSALADIDGDGAVDYVTTRAPCAPDPSGFPSCDPNPNPSHPSFESFKTLVFIPGRGDGNFGCTRPTPSCVPAIASPGYNEFTPSASAKEVVMHGTAPDDPSSEMAMPDAVPFLFADLTDPRRGGEPDLASAHPASRVRLPLSRFRTLQPDTEAEAMVASLKALLFELTAKGFSANFDVKLW